MNPDHLEFVHGFNDTPAPPEVTEAGYLLRRMREANPTSLVYLSDSWRDAETRMLGPGVHKGRAAEKRKARNRARTKAAHRARMAQKGRK